MAIYELGECVFEGSTSRIYRATQEPGGTPVLVKRLRELYPSPAAIAGFRRELEITKSVAGEGVIGAHELLVEGATVGIVVEDYGARSLAALAREARFDLETVLRIGIQVAEALGRVHRKRVVHKDVNPANIVWNAETGVAKLIDFGISQVLSRESAQSQARSFEGTPLYMSPEQTGRMNRSVDSRADLYSLGATLYQLLTGRPPFERSDRLELVHAHIAKTPTSPHVVDPEVPEAVSQIVMTLLEKWAEDRYQNASGLAADLQRCLDGLLEGSAIPPFVLRARDIDERLRIPQRLYGRSSEVALLEDALRATAEGQTRVMLVGGYSGVGKTSLVHEVLRSLSAHDGRFVEGKFDAFNRGTPYASPLQAFTTLVRQILTEDSEKLASWSEQIRGALGANLGVLVEVIPELAHIVGTPDPVEALGPAESRNRFRQVVGDFIRAMASPAHPLVIFLDDLQWADVPSVELVAHLATDPDTRHVLLVGAYRDNEVDAAHPLRAAIEAMEADGAAVDHVVLGPLTAGDVERLVCDALLGAEGAEALAAVCHGKTRGNAFFLNRFLDDLFEKGLLGFDAELGSWTWDVSAIEAHDATDNVVEYMSSQIDRLDEPSRAALRIGACIGDRFDLETLAAVHESSKEESQRLLRAALEAELIRPADAGFWHSEAADGTPNFVYTFVHDRVRQAAHAGLEPRHAARIHERIAQTLLSDDVLARDASRVFELVEHLNRGAALATSRTDHDLRADMNLLAARRASASAAFQPAHEYYGAALAHLDEDAWSTRYEVALAVHVEGARAAYLSGAHEAMERCVAAVIANARTALDAVAAREVKIQGLVAQQRFRAAVELALETIAPLGVSLPMQPTPEEVQAQLVETLGMLGEPSTAMGRITAMDRAEDPSAIAAMRIMNQIMSSAYLAVPQLLPMLACSIVQSILKRGLAIDGVYGFAILALVLTAVNMLDLARAVGNVALGLLECFEDRAARAKNMHVVQGMVFAYLDPLREMLVRAQHVFRLGVDTGDIEYACWALHTIGGNGFYAGVPLEEQARVIDRALTVLTHHKQEQSLNCTLQFRQLLINLRGGAEDPRVLVGPDYDQFAHARELEERDYRGAAYILAAVSTLVRYLFGDFDGAIEAADDGAEFADGATATYHIVCWHQYRSLAVLARLDSDSTDVAEALAEVEASLAQLETLAAACPENFAHRVALLEAERARVEGRDGEAMAHYEAAIRAARENRFMHEEALANELAGRFFSSRGSDAPARGYLLEACYLYGRWGASAKVTQLEEEHSELFAGLSRGASASSAGTMSTTGTQQGSTSVGDAALDLATLFKAASMIATEIQLENLIATIMDVAIENAGATHGFFIVEEGGALRIDAAKNADGEVLAEPGTLVEAYGALAHSLITYVARTNESLVLPDARKDPRTRNDAHVAADRPLSVLCLPLEHKGVRRGIIYLENDLTADAFTPERIQMQELLLRQAAISLENAHLYNNLRESLETQVALTHAHHRFVPHQFLETLERSGIEEVVLGDNVRKKMSVLFSDMRAFTTHVEGMTSEESILFINRYLHYMEPQVTANRGFVDSYIGDAIMALFDEADDALNAGRGMVKALRDLNRERQERGLAPIEIGVGVNTGDLTLGTIGAANHIKCGVIGDSVNLASRVESLTVTYGVTLLTTDHTLEGVRDRGAYALRMVDRVVVKGRLDPVTLYEVFDADPDATRAVKHEVAERFDEALACYYDRRFDAALRLLSECQAALGEDRVVANFVQRCWRNLADPPPADWAGVEHIAHK